MIPISGYAPDLIATTPGILTSCQNLLPTSDGMESAKGLVPVSGLTPRAGVVSAVGVVRLDGAKRTFAGTLTGLYEARIGVWEDVSRSGGYTVSAESAWSFAQFGNSTLAANKSHLLQRSTNGDFADIAGSPRAAIVVASNGFALAFNTQDGTYGDNPNGWWCSALYDETNWTPSVPTQATRGNIIEGSGEIIAALPLGDYVVAYKRDAVFLGRYDGPPAAWNWQCVARDIGCVGPEAVVDIGGVHVFVSQHDVYTFDGASVAPADTAAVRKTLFGSMTKEVSRKVRLQFDREARRVNLYFAKSGSRISNATLSYHLDSKRWGVSNKSISAVLTYAFPQQYINDVNGMVNSVGVTFDALTWNPGEGIPAVLDSSGYLNTITGPALDSSFTTGDIGDDYTQTMLRTVIMRYAVQPQSVVVSGLASDASGSQFASKSIATPFDGHSDVRQTARWHRITAKFTGMVRLIGYVVDAVEAGSRGAVNADIVAMLTAAPRRNLGVDDGTWVVDTSDITFYP